MYSAAVLLPLEVPALAQVPATMLALMKMLFQTPAKEPRLEPRLELAPHLRPRPRARQPLLPARPLAMVMLSPSRRKQPEHEPVQPQQPPVSSPSAGSRSSPGHSSSLLKELVLGLQTSPRPAADCYCCQAYLYLCRATCHLYPTWPHVPMQATCADQTSSFLPAPEMNLQMPELHMMEKCPAQKIGHHVGLGLSNQTSRLAIANQANQANQANRMNQGNQLGVPRSC